jgi:hypothetical protein
MVSNGPKTTQAALKSEDAVQWRTAKITLEFCKKSDPKNFHKQQINKQISKQFPILGLLAYYYYYLFKFIVLMQP